MKNKPKTSEASVKKAIFHCRLTVPPVVKKNSKPLWRNKRTGKLFPGSNKCYAMFTKTALWELVKARRQGSCLFMPLHTKFTFYGFWDENNGKRPDLNNLYDAPLDWLEGAGVIANDRLVRSHDGSRLKFVCADCPWYCAESNRRLKSTSRLKRCPGTGRCDKAGIEIQIFEFERPYAGAGIG